MTLPRPPTRDSERLEWLRLCRSENVGPVTFQLLLKRYGNARSALEAIPTLARSGGRNGPIKLCTRDEADAENLALTEHGGRFVMLGEADYPPLLAAAEAPPPILSAFGQTHLSNTRCIAIVGARNASAAGIRIARRMAHELGVAGFAIVSGLARGIDASAHNGALETGTIAILAGGIDVIYPPEHAELYQALSTRGLILSEMPFGTAPQARHFPRRNRIISAISEAVLVVEAAERSGSLITARFALEQGREVLAVPGSPLDARAHGTNKLIRSGATLVQSAADVMEALNEPRRTNLLEPAGASMDGAPLTVDLPEKDLELARLTLSEKLSPVPVEVDELVRQTALPLPLLLTVLLELEIAGRLHRHPGQRVSLLP